MECLNTSFGSGKIMHGSNGAISTSFSTATTHTNLISPSQDIETVMKMGFMWRYMGILDTIKASRLLASEQVQDEVLVDKIFHSIDVCDIGQLGPASIIEPAEVTTFVKELGAITLENNRLKVENNRLKGENYTSGREYSRIAYQLEICLIELSKSRKERLGAIDEAVASATKQLRADKEEAVESAASLYVALEVAKGLCLQLQDGDRVNLSTPEVFDLRIMLKASMVQVAELNGKVCALEAEIEHLKASLNMALNFKASRYR